MLPVTGYVDRWSVAPGETIRFMVSSQGGAPYRARLARVFCGDPNPDGPGYREVDVPSPLDGEHAAIEQPVHPGSRAVVDGISLGDVRLTFCPTLPDHADPQTLLHWEGREGSFTLDIRSGRLGASWCDGSGEVRAELPTSLPRGRWADVAVRFGTDRLELALRQHERPFLPEPGIESVSAPMSGGPGPEAGRLTFASRNLDAHFNGRLEDPSLWKGSRTIDALLERGATRIDPRAPGLIAAWDFSIGIDTDRIVDLGPDQRHGRLANLPTRAVAGSRWSGDHHRWTDAPRDYAAIHFHDDDVGDLEWQVSHELRVPADWPSGLYVLHVERDEARDNIPFVARAAEPGSQARIALLLPTLTYQIYGQYPRGEIASAALPRARQWGALAHAAADHPEYGLSAYNTHRDGSGVTMTSMRRPMLDKRVNQIHRLDETPGGSGTYWLAADTYLIDWLDRRGIPCEIITDHDLHDQGVALLRRFTAVMTGQHPEYHTERTRSAIEQYIETGGRFLYLGGNGFYWKIVAFQDDPWAVEVRRAEGGIRTWASEPGEYYHAFDGSLGGLWRRLGKPPQALVGVGFSSQGEYRAEPYRFADAILDPRVAFARSGIEAAAVPGGAFGERGLMGGGAAGHETDRADERLGTPAHALVIATGLPQHASFEPANEERLTQEWPGPREAIVRSDIVFFETAAGGAVFSVGSMSFIGGLPIDDYRNVLARLLENVVRRFSDETAFRPVPSRPA